MSAAHRATGRALFRAGPVTALRLILAVVTGILLFGGAAYGGSRMLAGDGGSGRPAAAAEVAPVAPNQPAAAAEPTPSAPSAPQASPSGRAEATSAKPSKAKPTAGRTTAAPTASAPVAEVLRLVNVERGKAGCRALTVDSRLAAAASSHSADMAANDYFSHTGRNGSSVSQRVEAAGYRWSGVGENIAKGQPTPAAVMTAWMNSSGHRANILNCNFRNIGIGLAYDGRSPVWTQDFGTPA